MSQATITFDAVQAEVTRRLARAEAQQAQTKNEWARGVGDGEIMALRSFAEWLSLAERIEAGTVKSTSA